MLLNQELLEKISNKTSTACPRFNIDTLLFLLQISTRIVGYPNYKFDLNPQFHIQKIKEHIDSSRQNKNFNNLYRMMNALGRLAVGFCYFQNSLSELSNDKQLLALLCQAIDARENTTNEERCAEKSLLIAFAQQSQTIYILLDLYWPQIKIENILEMSQEVMQVFAKTYIKEPENVEMAHIVIDDKWLFIENLKPYISTKNNLKLMIGQTLLMTIDPTHQPLWLADCHFLSKAMHKAKIKQDHLQLAKQGFKKYIKLRRSEYDLFSLFKSSSRNTKLSAAQKYLKMINGNNDVNFTKQELAALNKDKGSRLTNLYNEHHLYLGC